MTALDIRPLAGRAEAAACASMMCSSDPWKRLGRSFDESLAIISDPRREVYVAHDAGRPVAFIILDMQGAFVGYVRSICVAADVRSRGIGSEVLRFAEERIFRDSPNVFLCVSSFNPRAKKLYESVGYETVGELKDYLVRGHSEFLMRKSIGPLMEFTRR